MSDYEPTFYYSGNLQGIGYYNYSTGNREIIINYSAPTFGLSNVYCDWYIYSSYNDNQGKNHIISEQYPYSRQGSVTLIVKPGYQNFIQCKVRIYYYKTTATGQTTTEYVWGTAGGGANAYVDDYVNLYLEKYNYYTLCAYTQNSANYKDFWKNGFDEIATGKYIQDHLTMANLDQWLEQVGIWNSWKQQKNLYGTYGRGGATSKGDITALWYNTMAGYCGASTVTGLSQVIDKTKATTISADHFITLAQKVTTWS